MYFDTHAHLDDASFDSDRDELIASFPEVGVTRILNASSNLKSCEATISLCDSYDMIYGAVGIHPDSAESFSESDLERLEALSRHRKICAIGEIGLDYYYDDVSPELQRIAFEKQVGLAYELKMPVIVHDRDAHRDCFDILSKFPGITAVFHCFSGSVEFARELVKAGYYLSFGGALTFKNARHAPEVVKSVPRERIMLETDCPYMAPVPFRGKRNHPGFIPQIAEKVSELWGVSPEEVGEITTKNANIFFRLED